MLQSPNKRNKNGIHSEIKSSQIRGKSATIRFRKFSPSLTKYETVKTLANKTIVMPVILYGCKTWSCILSEEHRLTVLENSELRKVLGSKRKAMTG